MVKVFGRIVDNQTRCKHYHTDKDIVAIKFKCCNKYYPCYKCHEELEHHPIAVWPKDEFNEKAILCGVCRREHTINEYLSINHCLSCESSFNERCAHHYYLYFEVKNNNYCN
ncbi:CHY zinc finger protein [Sporosarcina pasteurii]|uniref:Uncharacterized conserved protein n=1 Tax=Sporosarcina pasteurii TaxID=1474 RepID=A0A380BRV0_SPOPA|nr:CHY zinc finger protein [Sporosarcina pasteurii]MDS9471186.1 CHY zinc finger protein [Sporosarcina pasteurii]QBQ05175.1 hypothetical protein E2C16_05600 [Sporosarcina pasteurii]SUJ05430.1 Uncharacterized conserved protein [Sporosarcina pasteurii]